jgi:hypothetical protein
MPNWCENRVYIESTPEQIEAIIAAILNESDKKLLNYLLILRFFTKFTFTKK